MYGLFECLDVLTVTRLNLYGDVRCYVPKPNADQLSLG